jgi:hypothetical protein
MRKTLYYIVERWHDAPATRFSVCPVVYEVGTGWPFPGEPLHRCESRKLARQYVHGLKGKSKYFRA